MSIDYPPDVPRLSDPRLETALKFLGSYQHNLRDSFAALPAESRFSLSRMPNPHLATGKATIIACADGVVASIHNGLGATEIKIEVVVPDNPSQTMVEYYNSTAKLAFTFTDPVSKLSAQGYTATFRDDPAYARKLVRVVVADRVDRPWVPPASKILLLGWEFLEHCNYLAESREAARESLASSYGFSNLKSFGSANELLEEYRCLLDNARSESELQNFLQRHPELIYPEHDEAVAKPALAGEREPDFGFSIRSASGSRWVFVEIE